MIKLIFLTGPLGGHRYAIEHDVSLGRDLSNDIVIPDPAVSLVHCQIAFESRRPIIKDLGSTNGIRVNGLRVISQELLDGDAVFIGNSRLRLEWVETTSGPDGMSRVTHLDRHEASRTGGDLSGDIFGNVSYYLKREIAIGGMGAIYEAEQFGAEGFIKRVAVKTILPSFVQRESFVSSFVGEAKLVANLVHPNIVQIHHLGRHEGGYYIAMEYIDGVDLTRFMRAHKRAGKFIPVDLALLVMSRVCLGLGYAHNKRDREGKPLGLVHRDVSPNNIMITREGEVKLTDFGVAKAAQFMEEEENYLVGSVEYMSPEQAACRSVDMRSDIFSLGLVGFELLTNARLFQRGTEGGERELDEVVARVIEARIPDPRGFRPDLPERVVHILENCLGKEPDERYASAEDLGADLDAELHALGRVPTAMTMAKYLESQGLPEEDEVDD